MTKAKISATLSPQRISRARQVTGKTNLSEILDDALEALIERELEARWLAAGPDVDAPGAVPVDLTSVPWDEEA